MTSASEEFSAEAESSTETRESARPDPMLVTAAFDEAARHSTDPRQVLRLAALEVMQAWRRARQTSAPPSSPTTPTTASAVRRWWLGRNAGS